MSEGRLLRVHEVGVRRALVALAACYLPARRVLRIESARSLQE